LFVHLFPHPPQFNGSPRTLTHELPHHAVPVAQQLPCVQYSVDWHAVPQLPQ
jgi:hypothetical protein